MTPKRKFYRKGYQHIFQISVDRGLIFYTDADFIVFFSILCYAAVKYHVRIISCCIMANHFHVLAKFRSPEDMELFVNELTSIFALMYNKRYHRKGQLFKKSFGSSPKIHDDEIVNTVVYISNNPIPKLAVEHAVEYRWNCLAFMESSHPFSDPLDKLDLSDAMRRSMSIVERQHSSNKYLTYRILDELFIPLNPKERKQLTDYIISVYSILDYSFIRQKWDSLEKLSVVLDAVKGADYETAEDYSKEDYRHYCQMNNVARRCGFDPARMRFDTDGFNESGARFLRREFLQNVSASAMEIDKYLHQGEYARRVPRKMPYPAGKCPQGTGNGLPCGIQASLKMP